MRVFSSSGSRHEPARRVSRLRLDTSRLLHRRLAASSRERGHFGARAGQVGSGRATRGASRRHPDRPPCTRADRATYACHTCGPARSTSPGVAPLVGERTREEQGEMSVFNAPRSGVPAAVDRRDPGGRSTVGAASGSARTARQQQPQFGSHDAHGWSAARVHRTERVLRNER